MAIRTSDSSATGPSRGWHSRGYLPHVDAQGLVQFVTFRLADSVPRELIQRWREELALDGNKDASDSRHAALQKRVERYIDAGHGACHLSNPMAAKIVRESLLFFDGQRYRLLAWCVMPNHVHVLLEMTSAEHDLAGLVQSWKSYSARRINRLLGLSGPLWMPDYFDRYVRDSHHLAACLRYIRENPVKAGLVRSAGEWRWSGDLDGLAKLV